MTICQCTRVLAFAFIAPVAALVPGVMPPRAQVTSHAEAAALHARFDPSLDALRAGRVDVPAPLRAIERAELGAAQQHSTCLAALRAGFEPSEHEWTWLAIGACIVLLIILI
jgi:hypothetical protein